MEFWGIDFFFFCGFVEDLDQWMNVAYCSSSLLVVIQVMSFSFTIIFAVSCFVVVCVLFEMYNFLKEQGT